MNLRPLFRSTSTCPQKIVGSGNTSVSTMAPAGMGNSYLWADYRAVAEAEVESHHSVNAAIAWVASVRGEGPSLFGRLSKLPVGEINRVDRGSGLFLVGFICIRRRIPK